MDFYKDFQALAKRYHKSVGQAVYWLAVVRCYREYRAMKTHPFGEFPKSIYFRAFVQSFPCCVCGEEPLEDLKGKRTVKSYLVHEGKVGASTGSDYSAVPLCKRCLKDDLAKSIVVASHLAIQNRLFEAYIRSAEGT